ncbi:hypothetical protein O988_09608 [Pseudogymnoascus sp. VKM F-3808]|nr:hypothetical protein O988_09608 [Pseudogymnoascus sp. VKM F-3808]
MLRGDDQEMIKQHFVSRLQLAALFVTKGLQSKEGQTVLQDVYSLCNDDNQVAYRPDEQPVDGDKASDALQAHTQLPLARAARCPKSGA